MYFNHRGMKDPFDERNAQYGTKICNITHAYHQTIGYGQELVIQLAYKTAWPKYGDTFACGVYYNCEPKPEPTSTKPITVTSTIGFTFKSGKRKM